MEFKWIKVEDQLPERWETVWLYGEIDGIFLGYYSNNRWFRLEDDLAFDITHWCELIIPDKPNLDKLKKEPKFKVNDFVVDKYNGCLYKIGAYRLFGDGEYWYALHGYEYMVNENLLELYIPIKSEEGK